MAPAQLCVWLLLATFGAAMAQDAVVAADPVAMAAPATVALPPTLPTAGTTAPDVLAQLALPADSAVSTVVPATATAPGTAPATTAATAAAVPPSDDTMPAGEARVDVPVPRSVADAAVMTSDFVQAEAGTRAAAATSTAAVAAAASVPSLYAGIFEQHNYHRAVHQVAALTWSDTLAAQAASWAAGCNFAHSGGGGENLYMNTATTNTPALLLDAIRMWMEEQSAYSYSNPGFSASTGHFTQVVWKGTTQVGCGVAVCTNGVGTYVVCRYTPPGNVLGQFPQNVFPPSSNPPAPPTKSSPAPVPKPNPQPKPIPPATLPAGYKFSSPGCLGSVDKRFWLCCQNDGNLVLYQWNGAAQVALWASNSAGRSFYRPFALTMQTNGDLVVSDSQAKRVWRSATAGRGVAPHRLVVQNDGNVVIFDANRSPVWATNTGGR